MISNFCLMTASDEYWDKDVITIYLIKYLFSQSSVLLNHIQTYYVLCLISALNI